MFLFLLTSFWFLLRIWPSLCLKDYRHYLYHPSSLHPRPFKMFNLINFIVVIVFIAVVSGYSATNNGKHQQSKWSLSATVLSRPTSRWNISYYSSPMMVRVAIVNRMTEIHSLLHSDHHMTWYDVWYTQEELNSVHHATMLIARVLCCSVPRVNYAPWQKAGDVKKSTTQSWGRSPAAVTTSQVSAPVSSPVQTSWGSNPSGRAVGGSVNAISTSRPAGSKITSK